jgi:hypothetical protein
MGALINASANSTSTVAQRQHGHMQVNANLHPSQTHKFFIIKKKKKKTQKKLN